MAMWISVEDRLPESDINCLVYVPSWRDIRHLVWCSRYQCWDDSQGDDTAYEVDQTTHWMPFPDHPAQAAATPSN